MYINRLNNKCIVYYLFKLIKITYVVKKLDRTVNGQTHVYDTHSMHSYNLSMVNKNIYAIIYCYLILFINKYGIYTIEKYWNFLCIS